MKINHPIEKIALGGGCHWCTEAVFQSLKGVKNVLQGYALVALTDALSEAVIIEFDSSIISVENLIEIHLFTHNSTSLHSMRDTYVSAVYFYSEMQQKQAIQAIKKFQNDFEEKIITQVLPFQSFKPSRKEIQNYYLKNPSKPFCKRYINPKLEMLRSKFSSSLISE